MTVLEQFKHADTFLKMPMSDRIAATMYVVLLGMGITFIALVLIWGLTILLSKAVQTIEKKVQPAVVPVQKSAAVATPTAPTAATDTSELIAVITAAIAANTVKQT